MNSCGKTAASGKDPTPAVT